MAWIKKNRRAWRIALLILMLVALMGPWTFDRLYVPSEYECSAPNIRLDGNFCGVPLSGVSVFFWMSSGLIPLTVGVITGEVIFSERSREFLLLLLLFLPLLPIFSTLLLIPQNDQQPRQVFTIIAWALAIGMVLFWWKNSYPNLLWVLWGIWLYIGLAVNALILEIITLRFSPTVNIKHS